MNPEDEQRNFPTTIIPDPTCPRAGLMAQWAGIDKISVHAFIRSTEDVESELAPCDANVHHLRSASILFDPVIRKLVNESNGTFLAGQKITPLAGPRQETLKLSRQYRSIVRACIENLQDIVKTSESEQYQQYIAIFYNIEFIWHLCEILYVDIVLGDTVLPQLVEWIRFHFPEGEQAAAEILSGPLETGAEVRFSFYWDTVIKLVLQGNTDPVRALLRLHSDADTEPFLTADTLLRNMPVYNVYGGLSVAEFTNRWKTWQGNVNTHIENGTFRKHEKLQLIMKIVGGELVPEIKQHSQAWYQLMISVLLYTEPTVKYFDLSYHANQCITQFGGPKRLKLLDHIIVSLLENDLNEVIKKLQYTCDSGWAAAHLTNLLYLCGRLTENQKTSDLVRIHEHLLLEYGTVLMSNCSLWQVGVTYLDHCSTEGQARLELLLPRLPLGSEQRVMKIIQMALDRGMPHVANSICKAQGMRCLRNFRIGQALNWALQSQDSGFTTYLADKILQRYATEGVFHSHDLLDNLGPCMLVSDRLTFLGKYCEFHQLYQNREMRKAAQLLCNLLTWKISPKYFWLTLLTDALPLLESQDVPVFTYEETCQLITCLEELIMECHESLQSKKSCVIDRTKLIRLALTKNLARALIHEGSISTTTKVTSNTAIYDF